MDNKSISDYNYLTSLYKRRKECSDTELLDFLKEHSGITELNGEVEGRLFAGLIEEVGIRKIYEAAPVIVNYSYWPAVNDCWISLVHSCYEALKKIGNDTIVDDWLKRDGGYDLVNKIINTVDPIPEEILVDGFDTPFNSLPDLDSRGRVLWTVLYGDLINSETISKWSNNTIIKEDQTIPEWLWSFAKEEGYPQFQKPSFEETVICIIALWKKEHISFSNAIQLLTEEICEDYDECYSRSLFFTIETEPFSENFHIKDIRRKLEECFDSILKPRQPLLKMIEEILNSTEYIN